MFGWLTPRVEFSNPQTQILLIQSNLIGFSNLACQTIGIVYMNYCWIKINDGGTLTKDINNVWTAIKHATAIKNAIKYQWSFGKSRNLKRHVLSQSYGLWNYPTMVSIHFMLKTVCSKLVIILELVSRSHTKAYISGWNKSFLYILFAHALAMIILESELVDAIVFNLHKPKQIKTMF